MYGIYDGHGGKFVSKYLSENVPKYFLNPSVKYPLSGRYIRESFKSIQSTLEKKHNEEADYCGSTCLLAVDYIYEKKRIIDIINIL